MLSGSLVGLSLGLVGGGGSILAVPLLVYVVGVASPHVAIGTSAVAVAANAAANLFNHSRAGNVRWPAALTYAGAGAVGAAAGSTVGKTVNGQALLALFAVLMIVIAVMMLRKRNSGGSSRIVLDQATVIKLVGIGLVTGMLSGFFGIGGGFLIVPGLMLATGMPIIEAVGSSLVSVTTFGATAAINYASSGLIDWTLAGVFVAGGLGGGIIGSRLAGRLSKTKGALNIAFAVIIIAVAIYMLFRSVGALF